MAFSEPLHKQLNLLKVKDMIDLKPLKFLHKLNASLLMINLMKGPTRL